MRLNAVSSQRRSRVAECEHGLDQRLETVCWLEFKGSPAALKALSRLPTCSALECGVAITRLTSEVPFAGPSGRPSLNKPHLRTLHLPPASLPLHLSLQFPA
jgi:hypothetical protein